MASPKIKASYALDAETVRLLERMARHWHVSKSEALRRAIRTAASEATAQAGTSLEALENLKRSVGMTSQRLGRWARAIGSERRTSSGDDEPNEK